MSVAGKVRALVEAAYGDSTRFDQNYAQARAILEKALKDYPQDTVLLTCYGAVLSDIGHHDKAVSVLRNATSLGSRDRNTWFNLGVALVNTGQSESGRECFAKASRLKPDSDTWEAYFDPQAH